jgi:predicted RNA-binding protein with PUA-like domain
VCSSQTTKQGKRTTTVAYWLVKTEPSVYSFEDLQREGKALWDGVTNSLALKHLRSMKKGDLTFVYHTGNEKRLVGIAEIASDPYPDPSKKNPMVPVIELRPKAQLTRVVTLAEIRRMKEFSTFELVRVPRLSVMPVTRETWDALISLSGHQTREART